MNHHTLCLSDGSWGGEEHLGLLEAVDPVYLSYTILFRTLRPGKWGWVVYSFLTEITEQSVQNPDGLQVTMCAGAPASQKTDLDPLELKLL